MIPHARYKWGYGGTLLLALYVGNWGYIPYKMGPPDYYKWIYP